MKKKEAVKDIDFADSEFRSFELKENNDLVLYLTSWDGRLITLTFNEPIHFTYDLGDDVTNIYEVIESSPLLEKALSSKYIKIPPDHSFKLFLMEDLEDFPFIQIVANSIKATKGTETIRFKRDKQE